MEKALHIVSTDATILGQTTLYLSATIQHFPLNIFYLPLVESTDAEPTDTEGWLYFLLKLPAEVLPTKLTSIASEVYTHLKYPTSQWTKICFSTSFTYTTYLCVK